MWCGLHERLLRASGHFAALAKSQLRLTVIRHGSAFLGLSSENSDSSLNTRLLDLPRPIFIVVLGSQLI
jgi:hypothetical protein